MCWSNLPVWKSTYAIILINSAQVCSALCRIMKTYSSQVLLNRSSALCSLHFLKHFRNKLSQTATSGTGFRVKLMTCVHWACPHSHMRLDEQCLPAPGMGNCRSCLFSIVWLGTAGATPLLSHLSGWIWSFTFSSVLTVLLKYLKILQPPYKNSLEELWELQLFQLWSLLQLHLVLFSALCHCINGKYIPRDL